MRYTVIYRMMSTSIYISTLNRSQLLENLNGEGSIFGGMKILGEFPAPFQSSYGSEVNEGWPYQSLLILAENSIVVPRITKKLVYYSLED